METVGRRYPEVQRQWFSGVVSGKNKRLFLGWHEKAYGWLDWVEGYHDIVKQTPYSMNGMIAYLKNSMPSKRRDELSKLEYFYKMCHGYTHGSVQGAIYPELHYFEISIMLYYAIRNTFIMLCRKHDEELTINGEDVVLMADRDIVELLEQYEKRSTENFKLQQRRFQK